MAGKKERFLAALLRDGETNPFEFIEVDAADWAEAAGCAKVWASKKFSASGGVPHPTSLYLKQGVASVFVIRWDSPDA